MSNGTDVKPSYATDVKPSYSTERRMVAWIGKAVRVEGRVIGGEDLTIDGDVEGSIELGGHSLTIGQDANIKADLLAKTVMISGKVKGNIKGVEKVDLSPTASVQGDISAPRFSMADGATVVGKISAGK
jgi:cytoskeletal protein CcmA (bactofilin family)